MNMVHTCHADGTHTYMQAKSSYMQDRIKKCFSEKGYQEVLYELSICCLQEGGRERKEGGGERLVNF